MPSYRNPDIDSDGVTDGDDVCRETPQDVVRTLQNGLVKANGCMVGDGNNDGDVDDDDLGDLSGDIHLLRDTNSDGRVGPGDVPVNLRDLVQYLNWIYTNWS